MKPTTTSGQSNDLQGPPSPDDKLVDWGALAFLVLAVVAYFAPYLSAIIIGPYWAVAVAIVVAVLWFRNMQTTCINGAMICSLVAFAIAGNMVSTAVIAIIHFAALFRG